MGKTKDERFLMKAYETAFKINPGDILDVIMNKHEMGLQCGISPKASDTICNLLAQANFIKKVGKEEFRLTSNGEALVKQLLGEK